MRLRRSLAVAATALAVVAPTASARTFIVNKHGDSPPHDCTDRNCTLREAIIAANERRGPDTVELPGKTPFRLAIESTGEDESADGDLDVTSPLRVLHRGFRHQPAIDAGGIDRVFDIHAPARIRGVAIRGGTAHPVDGDGDGGGVLTDSALRLKDVLIAGNRTTVLDGNGGGIDTDARALVEIRDSRIIGNVAIGEAGGVGGSIDGPTLLDNVVIVGNTGGEGGGVLVVGEVRITRSAIYSNEAVSGLDNEQGDGGGIYVDNQGVLTVENSTIAGNRALRSGGGVYSEADGIANLNSVTIARNRADYRDTGFGTGGGVRIDAATFEIANSIIALNTATDDAASDCGGATYTGTAPNLISTNAGGCDPGSEIVAPDPMIGDLADNGGETPTIALLPGSPAIDAGDPALAPDQDQRGGFRDDGRPDLGAFEL